MLENDIRQEDVEIKIKKKELIYNPIRSPVQIDVVIEGFAEKQSLIFCLNIKKTKLKIKTIKNKICGLKTRRLFLLKPLRSERFLFSHLFYESVWQSASALQ
jgi:hypothetical protein